MTGWNLYPLGCVLVLWLRRCGITRRQPGCYRPGSEPNEEVYIVMTRQIGCEEALKNLLEYLDREIDAELSQLMDRHLSTCRSCYSRMEFEKRLRSHIEKAGKQEVSERLKSRIDRLLADKGR